VLARPEPRHQPLRPVTQHTRFPSQSLSNVHVDPAARFVTVALAVALALAVAVAGSLGASVALVVTLAVVGGAASSGAIVTVSVGVLCSHAIVAAYVASAAA
jgi:hypothetical protein